MNSRRYNFIAIMLSSIAGIIIGAALVLCIKGLNNSDNSNNLNNSNNNQANTHIVSAQSRSEYERLKKKHGYVTIQQAKSDFRQAIANNNNAEIHKLDNSVAVDNKTGEEYFINCNKLYFNLTPRVDDGANNLYVNHGWDKKHGDDFF